MKTLKNLFALGLLCACTLAAAQWQWIDQDGRKVFSDRSPPPEIMEKNIIKRPGGRLMSQAVVNAPESAEVTASAGQSNLAAAPGAPASGPVSLKSSGLDKELEAKKKQAAEAEAAKKKTDDERVAKAKIENCARAKQAKANLDSGARIGRVNAAGEREIMDEAARAAEGKRLQAVMATDCS